MARTLTFNYLALRDYLAISSLVSWASAQLWQRAYLRSRALFLLFVFNVFVVVSLHMLIPFASVLQFCHFVERASLRLSVRVRWVL